MSDIELDDSLSLAASDMEALLGSVTDPALLPPVICFMQCQTQSGWRAHPRYDIGCQRARAWIVSACGTISQQAGRVVSSGVPSGSLLTLNPLLPRSARRAHKIVVRPLLILHQSFCFSCSHIPWRRWRKGIQAPASSRWVCGRTSLPAHSYRMQG